MNKSTMKKIFLPASICMLIILGWLFSWVAFAEKPDRISRESSQSPTTVTSADAPVPLSPETTADNPETAAFLAAETSAPPTAKPSGPSATEPSGPSATEPSAPPAAETSAPP